MPTIALSTGSLHTYGLARVFELAAQAGFDVREVWVDSNEYFSVQYLVAK